ncbi:MAG: SUMF1/EgtB/PvdO family nonheme iron enzyme [Polyangiaceae bacterium]
MVGRRFCGGVFTCVALVALVACGSAAAEAPGSVQLGESLRVVDRPNDSAIRSRSKRAATDAIRSGAKCPLGMVSVDDAYCIDRYEATVEEILPNGEAVPHPHNLPVDGLKVRAVSKPGVLPQAFISAHEAQSACRASGKRLCKSWEWRFACRGPFQNQYPYGNDRVAGRCNDHGKSAVQALHVSYKGGFKALNDPRLGLQPGTLAKTAEHEGCESPFGAYDMVGNVHEWVAEGTFAGGYYLDTSLNGEGCDYQTSRHNASYHDYSTGFRCCADMPPAP